MLASIKIIALIFSIHFIDEIEYINQLQEEKKRKEMESKASITEELQQFRKLRESVESESLDIPLVAPIPVSINASYISPSSSNSESKSSSKKISGIVVRKRKANDSNPTNNIESSTLNKDSDISYEKKCKIVDDKQHAANSKNPPNTSSTASLPTKSTQPAQEALSFLADYGSDDD